MSSSNPGTSLTEALDLEDHFGHWGEHPDHPVSDWQAEVSNDETRLGYWYWVESKLADLPCLNS